MNQRLPNHKAAYRYPEADAVDIRAHHAAARFIVVETRGVAARMHFSKSMM
jgi:hypothetical protein